MLTLRFLFVLALFVFPFCVFAQDTNDGIPTIDAATATAAAKERVRQETALLEQILADAKNLRLPENRAFVYAKVGNAWWQIDEKRARALFQNSIIDLLAAQTEAEGEKNNQQYLNNLIYGQSPRWEILQTIAARDAEFALDALVKTRPSKIAQAISTLSVYNQSPISQNARSEIQAEQRIIALAAEQNPQRAVKFLRESLKKDVSNETLNLLRKIHQKDAETANQIAEEVGQKLFDTKLNEDNQDTSLIQNFLVEFGQEKTEETATMKVSDRLIRDLTEKTVKFALRPNATSFYVNPSAVKFIEKYFPSSLTQIKQKQIKYENQNGQHAGYNKLMNGDAKAEELLSQADKYPRSYRNEIYRRAAEKTASSGNIAEAQKIITSNLTEEESERYLSQFNYNLATQAIEQGKFNEANQFIKQMSDENNRLSALIYLATSIYQKDPKENQKWAATVLDQARALVSDTPEKMSEMNSLLSIAAAYASIEPAQSFRLVESLVSPLNEFSEASAVVAKFSDYANIRQGEYPINAGNNLLGVYSLTSVLQTLKSTDFDHVLRFTNSFNRLDVRLSLEIQLIDLNLLANSVQMRPLINISTGRRHFTIDKK